MSHKMPNNLPVAAKPTRVIFDPFNSSATGHQRADSRLAGSTSWRDSRNNKLRQQYLSGSTGGKRVADTVGAGSEDFGQDGRLENGAWQRGASGLRTGGQQSIWESMKVKKDVEPPAKKIKLDMNVKSTIDEQPVQRSKLDTAALPATEPVHKMRPPSARPTNVVNPFTPFIKSDGTVRETSWTSHEERQDLDVVPTLLKDDPLYSTEGPEPEIEAPKPQIFSGLTIYINGSTMPFISDHKLKHLMSSHGAHTTVSLGRRTVTHVIVGRTGNGGCGGGLAGSKLHKEITKLGGKGIKFVTADWIVDSIDAGKRLSEMKYQGLKLSAKGVDSVANMFATKTKKS